MCASIGVRKHGSTWMHAGKRSNPVRSILLAVRQPKIHRQGCRLDVQIRFVDIVGSKPLTIKPDKLGRHRKAASTPTVSSNCIDSIKVSFGPDLAQLEINSPGSYRFAFDL